MVKESPCKNGCGQLIHFDKFAYEKTDNQKWIPYGQDGQKHACPNRQKNLDSQDVALDGSVKSDTVNQSLKNVQEGLAFLTNELEDQKAHTAGHFELIQRSLDALNSKVSIEDQNVVSIRLVGLNEAERDIFQVVKEKNAQLEEALKQDIKVQAANAFGKKGGK